MAIEYAQPDKVTGELKSTDRSDDQSIVNSLEGYRMEAEDVRKSGMNPRDDKWKENLDLYWNRYDMTGKADWQSQEVMPEVPSHVDRFAAALKEALVNSPEGFYTIIDPADKENDISPHLKEMLDVWLSTTGMNQNGTPLDFPSVFEEQMKLGALMACSAVVNWKEDVKGGRVAVETVDPRNVWLDHTYRNLYRRRKVELDRHSLYGMAEMRDGEGKPIFNLPEVGELVSYLTIEDANAMEALSGTGDGLSTKSNRVPIVIDEYMATVIGQDGKVIEEKGLYVVANNKFLIRGPEKNPYWHDKDWLIYAPLVSVPLSVYGRSYMEDFGSVAKTFNELTNMILDAVFTSSLKAWVMVPSLLVNPQQVHEGISPNKIFIAEEGVRAKDFAEALDLGTLPPEAVRVWEAMKGELREASGINEIGMGQFAPNSRTSATEISETKQSSSAMVRSIAQTVESRFLDPCLDLVWKTGLQHAKAGDQYMARASGNPELYGALIKQRRELISRPNTFQARGISTLIQRGKVLKNLMTLMQIIGSSETLMAEFVKVADMNKLIKLLFELSDVPMHRVTLNEREKLIREMSAVQGQVEGPGGPQAPTSQRPGAAEMRDVASSMGIAK